MARELKLGSTWGRIKFPIRWPRPSLFVYLNILVSAGSIFFVIPYLKKGRNNAKTLHTFENKFPYNGKISS